MKKKILLVVIFIITGILTGCGNRLQIPEAPIVYQREHGGEYIYLTEGDKVYVPYCPFKANMLGECIGYCDVEATEYSGAFREYVCELKGYSADQWIVSVMDAGCTEGMIMREINTTEIPEGFTSEYEWNQ